MTAIPAEPPKSTPKQNGNAKPSSPDSIRVAKLVFVRQGGHDLPGGYGLSVIKAGGQANKGTYELTFEPRIRHHRITYTSPQKVVEVAMVPAEWAWYVPATEE